LYGAVGLVVVVLIGGLVLGIRGRRRVAETVPLPSTAAVPGALHPETLTVQPDTPPLVPRAAEAIPDTVQFCPACGVPVDAVSEFCSNCGSALRPTAKATDATV
jgi:hypothetical protein